MSEATIEQDRIVKAVIFGGKARVAVISVKNAVQKAIEQHDLTPLAAAALGRALTAGAYINANLKNKSDRFNMIINGGGPIGKICIAGENGEIKGFVENPHVDLPSKNGKLDVGGAVGKDGELTVIKDLGLKEPYIGKTKLVSGEIAEDFTAYLMSSEGIANAVALGVLTDKNGCLSAGGVIVEAMPSATDDMVFILEDIITNFKNISTLLKEKTPESIADFFFGHLDAEIFPAEKIVYHCNCLKKILGVIRGLGEEEAREIIKERGSIEVRCDYCAHKYNFLEKDLEIIFPPKKEGE